MLSALTGPVLVGAVLLALAAPAKWRRPEDTVRALRAVGLPAGRGVVRGLAVAELLLAVAVVLAPGPGVLALLALACTGFGAFVLLALRAGTPLASCGCFGGLDPPPTVVHLLIVLALAALAAVAVGTGSSSLAEVVAAPATGLPRGWPRRRDPFRLGGRVAN